MEKKLPWTFSTQPQFGLFFIPFLARWRKKKNIVFDRACKHVKCHVLCIYNGWIWFSKSNEKSVQSWTMFCATHNQTMTNQIQIYRMLSVDALICWLVFLWQVVKSFWHENVLSKTSIPYLHYSRPHTVFVVLSTLSLWI